MVTCIFTCTCISRYSSFVAFLFQGKLFIFDKILKPTVTQEEVYDTSAKNIVAGKFCYMYMYILINVK